MFPRLKETIGTALDIVVEFSTLGEYRLCASSASGTASALTAALEPAPRLGGTGSSLTGVAVERIVAGGAAASRSERLRTPAATPAARRLQSAPSCAVEAIAAGGRDRRAERAPTPTRRRAKRGAADGATGRRPRALAPAVAEQLCFASV
jgi:hypothetical protein